MPWVKWVVSVAAVAFAFTVPEWAGFAHGTVAWFLCGLLLVVLYPIDTPALPWRHSLLSVFIAGLCAVFVGWAVLDVAVRTMPNVFAGPPDVSKADMLVILNAALTRLMDGGYPYVRYKIPWDTPLTQGPALWIPYVLPTWLNVDIRVMSLVGQLTIPLACGLVASRAALQGRLVQAAGLAALAGLAVLQPAIVSFHAIGHTQVYWPLLLVFAFLVSTSRWTAAAVVLGLLVNARSTFGAFVPVFFMSLYVRKAFSVRRAVVFVAAMFLPFVPFLIHDATGFIDSVFLHRIALVKGFVWNSTTWAASTYGVTGYLLRNGLRQYVEVAQAISLAIVYVLAWCHLRRGARPEPWMILALLVFSMTIQWSVLYTFFDVWLFALACLAGYEWKQLEGARHRVVFVAGSSLALALLVVLTAGARKPGTSYTIDVGTPASAPMTGGGFGRDEAVVEEGRTFVWVEDARGRIRVPRAGVTSARIRLTLRPYEPRPGLRQSVTIALNGKTFGTAPVPEGWTEVVFVVPRARWTYGFNLMDLDFGYAVSPAEAGTGPEVRRLSVALDKVVID